MNEKFNYLLSLTIRFVACRFPEIENIHLNMPNIHFLPVNLPTVGVKVISNSVEFSNWVLILVLDTYTELKYSRLQRLAWLCFP